MTNDLAASTTIPAMTVSQARFALAESLAQVWSDGDLPHESIDRLEQLTETLVEALVLSSADDDLELAEGPLEAISAAIKWRFHAGDVIYPEDLVEAPIEIYEALIEAGHLPGSVIREDSEELEWEVYPDDDEYV